MHGQQNIKENYHVTFIDLVNGPPYCKRLNFAGVDLIVKMYWMFETEKCEVAPDFSTADVC
jgi:hypothetical protein